ncbi:hypothetical protein LJR234_004507 [Mesorhizobium amorphae]|uniref:hypothetical protein n=1 Tax=Mesorhizobium amorphae TaxID=71433 RepID=UPI003ECD1EE2
MLCEVGSPRAAIPFANRSIAADGEQRPLLLPAGSSGVDSANACFVQGFAEGRVCCLVLVNQRSQFSGRIWVLARRLFAECSCRNRRGDDGAAGVEEQGAAVDPGRGELSICFEAIETVT